MNCPGRTRDLQLVNPHGTKLQFTLNQFTPMQDSPQQVGLAMMTWRKGSIGERV
jgi:hypothetical protein